MDGVHDLGGKHGHGAIQRDPADADYHPFHESWEGRVFAMTLLGHRFGAFANTDHFRHAVERIDPASYLSHGYYGRWLGGLENALAERGQLSQDTIHSRAGTQVSAARPAHATPVFPADQTRQPTALRAAQVEPVFAPGSTVRAAAHGWSGHTRLPAYVRGHVGEVRACHGAWVFPDTHAHGEGEQPQTLYTVAFSGASLWGDAAEPDSEVCIDLFESYLEAV